MNAPTIYVRLSCLTREADEMADDDDFVWPDDEPITPDCNDDPT